MAQFKGINMAQTGHYKPYVPPEGADMTIPKEEKAKPGALRKTLAGLYKKKMANAPKKKAAAKKKSTLSQITRGGRPAHPAVGAQGGSRRGAVNGANPYGGRPQPTERQSLLKTIGANKKKGIAGLMGKKGGYSSLPVKDRFTDTGKGLVKKSTLGKGSIPSLGMDKRWRGEEGVHQSYNMPKKPKKTAVGNTVPITAAERKYGPGGKPPTRRPVKTAVGNTVPITAAERKYGPGGLPPTSGIRPGTAAKNRIATAMKRAAPKPTAAPAPAAAAPKPTAARHVPMMRGLPYGSHHASARNRPGIVKPTGRGGGDRNYG